MNLELAKICNSAGLIGAREGVGQWDCRILACDEPVAGAVEPWLGFGAPFKRADR